MQSKATARYLSIPTIGAILVTHGCALYSCGNTEKTRVTAPNGAWDAVVYVRDCGATTGYSSHVSLVKRGRQVPNRAGNIVVYRDQIDVPIEWNGSDTLRIARATEPGLFQMLSVQGVTIVYGTESR